MKKVIRLTESDLHRIVKESVKKIIKESGKGLGYGLPDDEKKALRTSVGGYQPSEKLDKIEVDYGAGPFDRTIKRKVSPEQVRQAAHKNARGKKAPLARSQKYVTHSKMADKGEYGHNDYDEYVINYLCDKFNGVYLDGYIAVPVEDMWGEEGEAIRNEFMKYGYGEDESIRDKDVEYDLKYDNSGYQFDPNTNYMKFTLGSQRGAIEWDDPNGPYLTYSDTKLPPKPKIGTSEFMRQNN